MGQTHNKAYLKDDTEMIRRECRIGIPDAGSDDIMKLMTEGSIEDFLAALAYVKDINQRYVSYQNMTPLEYGCRVDLEGQRVEALLERRARADDLHPRKGCRALHIAAENLNLTAIRLLLQKSDPNALNLSGDNVLHVLCSQPVERGERVEACVTEVLRLCEDESIPLDVNRRNIRGETPIFNAAWEKNEPVVVLLLKHGCSIDSDDVQDEQGRRTTRQLLQPPEWPEFEHPLPLEEGFTRGLMFLLYLDQEDEFVERLPAEVAANPALLNAHDGKQTMLQVAAEKGLERAVKKLLELDADPNLTQPSELTAIESAAYKGFPEILRLLSAKNAILARENHLSTMHWLIKGADVRLKMDNPSGSEIPDDFKKCFDTFLELKDHKKLLNARDSNGCTPLHLAVMHHMQDSYFVDKLVDNGALLGLRDKNGNTPLDIMTPAELRKFLDRRIELSKPLELPKTVTFDIRFLKNFDDYEIDRYDCQSLVVLSQCKERRCVLTHPLVACFLHLKWKAIKLFYAIFFLLYSIFAVLLVVQIYLHEYRSLQNSSLVEIATVNTRNINESLIQGLNYFLGFFLATISVLSIVYYYFSWDSLHSVKRCVLKGIIVILSALFLLGICREHWHVVIANFVILLTSAEFVLLIGDYPKLAAYVKMLKTVTWNYFKFFVWFSPLIVGFILCFSVLFRDDKKESLYNLGFWFFRGFVMLSGELEAVELIEETTKPFLSHVIVIMFVFFLAIVLMNLLNALAVNDTVSTNEDTDMYVNISRIKLLHHAETVFEFLRKLCPNENGQNVPCLCRFVVKFIHKRVQALFLRSYVSEGKIMFEMNKKRKWISKYSTSKFILQETDIIKRAENIRKIENDEENNIRCLLHVLMRQMEIKSNDAT